MKFRSKRLDHFVRKIYRMRQVGWHMDAHLSDPLRLDDLCDIACMSRYQFLREFAAYSGETPMSRLWRLRLEKARQQLLAGTDQNVLELAIDCGFGSSEAFSRAFTRSYGCAPSQIKPLHAPKSEAIRIVRLPEIEIQSLNYSGSVEESDPVHDELRALAIHAGIDKKRRKGLMVFQDGDVYSDGRRPESQVSFKTALLSDLLGEKISGLETSHLPAGDYALLGFNSRFQSPPHHEIVARVAAETGRKVSEAIQFRRAHNKSYLPSELEFRFELYLPLEPISLSR